MLYRCAYEAKCGQLFEEQGDLKKKTKYELK